MVPRNAIGTIGLLAAVVGSMFSTASFAGVPSVEEVLKVCRENREKLNPLHVEATHAEERTAAYAKSEQQQAANLELLLKQLDDPKSAAEIEKQVPGISSAQYKQMLRESVKNNRALAQSVRFEHKYEFFIRGANYQVRSDLEDSVKDKKGWEFPKVPLSPAALATDYARVRIYSRAVGRTPPAQIWPGQPSPNSETYAMTSWKHIGETQNMRFPPFMQAMHPEAVYTHPIDTFYSAPADRYHVVGQEKKDGRLLTIVDVLVLPEDQGGRMGADGKMEHYELTYWCRSWLDLEQGGVPVELQVWYGEKDKPFDEHYRATPTREMKTTEIRRLANGAFYPARTVEEDFNTDPDAPPLSEAQWAEVRTGKRKVPSNVVHERYTWECTAVDTNVPAGDDFFVLKFPERQPYFDLDAGKVVGGLERTPAVKTGERAPAWKVARWLDGKQHTLEEFRGKVVVIDFWGLWCGACRNSVPAMATVEEKFKGKPVVFVSIHTADKDTEQLAARIEKFAAEQKWHFLAAIDSGTMTENSSTSHAYGCEGFPTEVVIGPDGRVCYNSSVAEPGMEGIVGKTEEQITPEDQVKIDAFEKAQFEAAGEKWPLAKDASEQEIIAVMNRMQVRELSRRIEAALDGKRDE